MAIDRKLVRKEEAVMTACGGGENSRVVNRADCTRLLVAPLFRYQPHLGPGVPVNIIYDVFLS